MWEPGAAHIQGLKQLEMVQEGLQKTLHRHQRQPEALQHSPQVSRQAAESLKRMMGQAQKEIEKVEKQMQPSIERHHRQLYEQLNSIPGLGKKSSLLLIVLTGGFTRFAHHKQLISYVGLSPRIYGSGTSVRGKSRICRMGMGRTRAVLYVCSWSAVRIQQSL